MISPTKLGIRSDLAGSGFFDAPRSKVVKNKKVAYGHKGVDFECAPGSDVIMPFDSGRGVRLAWPYADRQLGGVYFRAVEKGHVLYFKLFYFQPREDILQRDFVLGESIGVAQDVTVKYPGSEMKPHIHLEIDMIDPLILLKEKLK